MNSFEVALLRILVKKRVPVKLSTVIEGFPDGNEDSVLAAISSLRLKRYLDVTDYRPDGLISLIKDKRRQVVNIVSMDIGLPRDDDVLQIPCEEQKHDYDRTTSHSNSAAEPNTEKIIQVNLSRRRKFLPSTTFGKLAIVTVVIVGLLTLTAAGDLPSTSNPAAGPQPAAIHYYHSHGHHHSRGENNNIIHDDTANTMQAYYDAQKPIVSSSVALNNCTQVNNRSL